MCVCVCVCACVRVCVCACVCMPFGVLENCKHIPLDKALLACTLSKCMCLMGITKRITQSWGFKVNENCPCSCLLSLTSVFRSLECFLQQISEASPLNQLTGLCGDKAEL